MRYEHIDRDEQLVDFCHELACAPVIAMDTEFVSEDTFRPQLCLLQVAAQQRLAVIDPFAVGDLTPFWELLVARGHETVVHAGQAEFRFCLTAVGRRPHAWFDVQIAAGLVGMEYPAAYTTLISRLLGRTLPKGETRTDWRRRPLSKRQLEYALHDVMFLEPIHVILKERIGRLDRGTWLEEELAAWQARTEAAEGKEQWRRLPGLAGLSRQSLAIARELWRWREAEAQRRDCPPRRVLRDDLIVELSRRQTAARKHIGAVRGMQHRNTQRRLGEIADCIGRALQLPESKWPPPSQRSWATPPQLNLLAQFLSTALGCICREAQVAPSLAATVQDVRELLASRLGLAETADQPLPALARGWRAEVVGRVIDDLLAGKLAIRIGANPLSEQPLQFEPLPGEDRGPHSAEKTA